MTATIERYVKQQFMYFNKVMLRKNIEKQKINRMLTIVYLTAKRRKMGKYIQAGV